MLRGGLQYASLPSPESEGRLRGCETRFMRLTALGYRDIRVASGPIPTCFDDAMSGPSMATFDTGRRRGGTRARSDGQAGRRSS
jgi:hypothetical protein